MSRGSAIVGRSTSHAFEHRAVDRHHAVLAGLGPPPTDHFDHLVAVVGGHVLGFRVVGGEVVELPVVGLDLAQDRPIDRAAVVATLLGRLGEGRTGPGADGAPSVVVDRSVTEHLVVLGVVTSRRLAVVEGVGKAHALDRCLRHPPDRGRGPDAEGVQDGRHQVNGVAVLGADLTSCGDLGRPRHDAGVGGAAAVGLALPAPERRVPRVGPSPGVVVEHVGAAQLVESLEVLLDRLRHVVEEHHLVERSDRAALRARAVVGDEDEQGVVELADLLQEVDHPSELVIGVADEPGVHLHHPRVEPSEHPPTTTPTREHPGHGPTSSVPAGMMPISSWRWWTTLRYSSQPPSNLPLYLSAHSFETWWGAWAAPVQ